MKGWQTCIYILKRPICSYASIRCRKWKLNIIQFWME